jgi:uncharacterized membrane protein YGL010W
MANPMTRWSSLGRSDALRMGMLRRSVAPAATTAGKISMRTVTEWLGEYGASHQNATNKLLHWLCVPPIVLSVLGLLWSMPVPEAFAVTSAWLNWATLAAIGALAYYIVLSPKLAIGIALAFVALLWVVQWLDTLPWPLWATSIAIFVAAWIGQFIGHAVEGKRPSFFKDLQFLLIGPLWLVSALYRRLGVSY